MATTTTKIAAVVVAVIIIVAAVAVYLVLDDDDKDPGDPGVRETSAIYGNVNGDFYIDSTDVQVIEDIINGDRDAADWPLADANRDGNVDDEDLEIVKAASKGQSTTLIVVDYDGRDVAVQYPVTDYAATTGTNFRVIISVLGLADNMVANASNSYISEVLDKELYDGKQSGRITNLSSSGTDLTVDNVTTLVNLGVKIVLSEDSGMSSSSDVVTLMEGAGIVYLQLNYKDTYECLYSCKCLGILFGREKAAEDYCGWVNDIMDTIAENEGSLAGTATCLSVTMSNSVSGTSSDYYAATRLVGGNNVADWEASTKKFDVGDNWLFADKYNVDCIFHFRSTTFPTVTDSYFENARTYFGATDTFENGGYYLINGVTPLPVRNALMAQCLYPDCFEENWSDSLFQYYFEHFLGQEWKDYEYYWNVTATYP